MTLPKTTAAPHAAQKDRHTARNGAERGDKKQGGGAANWGTLDDMTAEAIEELRAEEEAAKASDK